VLLSDGRDEAADGFGPGSLHTLEEAATQAIRSEVMIFVVGLGRHLDRELAREWTRLQGPAAGSAAPTLQQVLERIGTRTGGRLLLSPGPGQLRRAFNDVADDLRNQYSIAYEPPERNRDGRFRRVEVRVPGRSDVEVLCREGYYDEAPER
jgi:VWFA-related protein